MIKSVIRKETFEEIYRRWDEATPVQFDCGQICGAMCCIPEPEDEEMGIYLLPGEEKMQDKNDPWLTWSAEEAQDYDFPASWKGKVHFVQCQGPAKCRRELRPIQCRTFPLLPHLGEEGLELIYNDLDLPYLCPLIEEKARLMDDFLETTYENWKTLLEDPLIYDLVEKDSKARNKVERVYPF